MHSQLNTHIASASAPWDIAPIISRYQHFLISLDQTSYVVWHVHTHLHVLGRCFRYKLPPVPQVLYSGNLITHTFSHHAHLRIIDVSMCVTLVLRTDMRWAPVWNHMISVESRDSRCLHRETLFASRSAWPQHLYMTSAPMHKHQLSRRCFCWFQQHTHTTVTFIASTWC